MNNPKHKLKLTYIASAVATFTRATAILDSADKYGKKEEYKNLLTDILYRLDSYSDNCDLGTLWNALIEKSHKKTLYKFYDESKHRLMVQSDSGGLQQITLGIKVTDEDRKNIFRRQAEYSTHAMNFDEMPVLVNENLREKFEYKCAADQGIKANHSIKYFVKELRYDKGRASGFNIKEQIEVFMEFQKNNPHKDCAKVLVIIQGWDIEDYNEYARGVFSVFNEMEEKEREKYYEYIAGISLGTSGIISYFRMLDLYCRAPIDLTEIPERFRTLIHILGLGGNNKSGVLFALQDGFFGKEVHYTYDSTTLTSVSTFGRYTEIEEIKCQRDGEDVSYIKAKGCTLGRVKITPKIKKFMSEVQDEFEDLLDKHLGSGKLTRDEFRNKFSPWRDDEFTGIKDFENAFGGKDCIKAREEYNNAISLNTFLHFALEAKTFMTILDHMKEGDFNSINDKEYRKALTTLSKIKNYDEYMQKRDIFKLILGFNPTPGSEDEKYHLENPGTNQNRNEKRASQMTYVETVEEFNRICENSTAEGYEDDEW